MTAGAVQEQQNAAQWETPTDCVKGICEGHLSTKQSGPRMSKTKERGREQHMFNEHTRQEIGKPIGIQAVN